MYPRFYWRLFMSALTLLVLAVQCGTITYLLISHHYGHNHIMASA